MPFIAKYPGKCPNCSQSIEPGQQIEWIAGADRKVMHVSCPTATATSTITAPAAVVPTPLQRVFTPPTPEFPPTPEQLVALTLFETGQSLAIEAGAGTGKTSTLILLAQSTQRRGQYLAFNKAIVNEARTKFPANVTCSTAHSLAYKATSAAKKQRLNDSRRMRSEEVARILNVDQIRFAHAGIAGGPKRLASKKVAGIVLDTITQFCQSADSDVAAVHVPFVKGIDSPGDYTNNNALAAHVLPYARRAWADLMHDDGILPFKHDHYLKQWQLSGPRIEASFILFDEAQDANPVMVAIVAAQTHAQLVWVGDSQQQIYSFTGAVNALANVPSDQRAFLTQSFRFGPVVADVANDLLARLDAELRVVGHTPIPSTVAAVDAPDAVLCRTNATAVRSVMEVMGRGLIPYLVGGGEQVVRFARAAADLMRGMSTEHPDLACFNSWGEVKLYVEEDEQGNELELLVKLIEDFGVDTIIDVLGDMADERDADVVVSTAHKSKGREWDTVQIAGDFPDDPQGEELRLLYVAVTRAKLVLDITAVAALTGGGQWAGAAA